jgi:hypothetical protein
VTAQPIPQLIIDATTRAAHLYGATVAAQTLTASFRTQEDWQRFYDLHHGPLPFAQKQELWGDEPGLVTVFVQTFLNALDQAGVKIYSRERADRERRFGVWCAVSGGVTGERHAWFKIHGIEWEGTEGEANAKAKEAQRLTDRVPHSCTFRYTVRERG